MSPRLMQLLITASARERRAVREVFRTGGRYDTPLSPEDARDLSSAIMRRYGEYAESVAGA